MKSDINTTLLSREITSSGVRSKSHRTLYSTRSLISDLDIVNELDGHSGCVNALSWSRSGNLLASGSDDQHLNIHSYQPADDSTNQFKPATTVATGHTQNIFSVKFMPHHNDRTVVTAAGDGEVRIFDLEYAGARGEASAASFMASEGRRRGRNTVFNGVRYLSDGDTDARVYRSHGDRVKRIVTESSPHLFLTCSEDGEVRQWDLRQPSSAYPSPRGSRFSSGEDSSVPPPLISYKRYGLDLNTISCSPSQPHYIALGGAHLHCFLHDRRMTGRDRMAEAGKSSSSPDSPEQDDQMFQATKCVRKFAPKGQQKMKRTENGHITACKISDARPDEMVVSWSGDHIYSFDLVRSPDASEAAERLADLDGSKSGKRAKEGRDRKRKRKANASDSSLGQQESTARGSSRPRTEESAALRVRYQNGQSEDIPIPSQRTQTRKGHLTEAQRNAQRIAKATVKIRSSIFGSEEEGKPPETQFSEALGHAASIMSDIDETMRTWGYPMEPSVEQVIVQKTLRSQRESTRRFVQASGTIARLLGGTLRTGSAGPSPLMQHFTSIEARTTDLEPDRYEMFGYDFLKAITLWLESGVGRLIEGFTRPADMPQSTKAANRLPIRESEASIEAIDDHLIPYLLRLASERPVVNLEANRFETEDRRQLFPSEKAAVLAFTAAIKIPFADLSSAVVLAEGGEHFQAQDRQTAMKFWGLKVARGILLNAAEGVTFVFVDRAFGGLGRVIREVAVEEEGLAGLSSAAGGEGAEGEERAVQNTELLDAEGMMIDGATAEDVGALAREARERRRQGGADMEQDLFGEADADEMDALLEEAEEEHNRQAMAEAGDEGDEMEFVIEEEDDEDDDDDDDDDEPALDEDDDDDSSEPDEIDGVPNLPSGLPRFMYTSAFERRRRKESVATQIPCNPATRVYRGHCNVRTVKDVNFFGPDDDYVVSGSDDGNFFIWDRKTSELVNVLEGDGEVVNVIQGHPYETLLAVSGIDHTIKIFSPDHRARAKARLGDGISAHDASEWSSIAWPQRIGRRVPRRSHPDLSNNPDNESNITSEPAMLGSFPRPEPGTAAAEEGVAMVEEDDEYVAPSGLASRKRMHDSYRIMNKNDVERQGGNQDAYITVPHAQLLQLLFGNMGNVGFFPTAFE